MQKFRSSNFQTQDFQTLPRPVQRVSSAFIKPGVPSGCGPSNDPSRCEGGGAMGFFGDFKITPNSPLHVANMMFLYDLDVLSFFCCARTGLGIDRCRCLTECYAESTPLAPSHSHGCVLVELVVVLVGKKNPHLHSPSAISHCCTMRLDLVFFPRQISTTLRSFFCVACQLFFLFEFRDFWEGRALGSWPRNAPWSSLRL